MPAELVALNAMSDPSRDRLRRSILDSVGDGEKFAWADCCGFVDRDCFDGLCRRHYRVITHPDPGSPIEINPPARAFLHQGKFFLTLNCIYFAGAIHLIERG